MKQSMNYVWLTVLALGMTVVVSSTARAQGMPKMDISGGYQFQRLSLPSASQCGVPNGGPPSCTTSAAGGWYVDFGYGVRPKISIVGQLDGSHKGDPAFSQTGLSINTVNYGAGVRYSQRVNDKVTPFGQLILGGAHVSSSGGDNTCNKCDAFALDIDGGVIAPVSGPWGVQVAIGYRRGFFSSDSDVGGGMNIFRFTAGIVYTISQ
jgi:hypothetical protein